ncbi:MAG TPA: inositol monophosphatase family protein [Candidatus Dormibacteraeota bacterium]|jgi:myo-inositol-1(or 4)-monophosphatase|nr:inositol monophosphatase family protein [Candidatus Dormibacteraeota bacterium]
MDLERLRDVALRAARAGEAVVLDASARGTSLQTQTKGVGDYVTAVDTAAEQAILAVLRSEAPDIPVLAEESGGERGSATFWAVDPLDGTTNFLRRFPVVGVSVGLMHGGEPVAAAVVAPFLGTAWTAAKGQGAHDHQGRRLQVRDGDDAGDGRGVVATGFPFRRPELRDRYLPVLERALHDFEDLRRAGAASLDLAYVSQGSFDGYFELNLGLWDIAAGSLLVSEAGGVVTDWEGDAHDVYGSGNILAGSPHWHARMLDIVRQGEHPRQPRTPRTPREITGASR